MGHDFNQPPSVKRHFHLFVLTRQAGKPYALVSDDFSIATLPIIVWFFH